MLDLLDILGTLAFAISGAFRGVKYELDWLGVTVLAIATGVGGGIIRDLLLGSIPPTALTNQTYIITCIIGAIMVICMASKIATQWNLVMAADAVGLSVFTAIGAAKAEAISGVPITTILMAMLTSSGGGVIRDLFVKEIPAVLTTDFYATAALLGGVIFIITGKLGFSHDIRLITTIVITLFLRVLAMKFHIRLPKVHSLSASPSEIAQKKREKHDQQ